MLTRALLLVVLAGPALAAWAGGSGLNVVVVVNQNSTNSVQLGNDYCEKRGVPPQNLFRMTGWTGGAVAWTLTEFQTNLRDPLLANLASSGLTNQIQYVLLSMDIPYRVEDRGSATSTTAALFYGFKTNTIPPADTPDSCSLPDYSSNSYAFSELPFCESRPNTADTNAFLSFMLTDDTLAGAEMILSRALAGDSSFPTQTVYLEKNSDIDRNVRFFGFDNAIFDNRIHGDSSVVRIYSDAADFRGMRGFMTGFAVLGLEPDAFVPGALGDSLTSYAGALFDNTGQTPLFAFLNAGAAASYGTVVEPCNYLQKFPDPLVFFYQRRGFDIAEAYYQSLLNPYQGLFVGEPLCAPFAQAGQADWPNLTNGSVLAGAVPLPTAMFSAAATNLPVDQVDLFIDGAFISTLTNIPPSAGTLISVTLNSSTVQYTVPADSTLSSVTAGLAAALNNASNSTRVAVFPTGDRLELQSLDLATSGSNLAFSATASPGTASLTTVWLTPAQPVFLDTAANGYYVVTISNSVVQGDWIQLEVTKTNGATVSLSVTNATTETNVANLCQLLMNAINAEPALLGPDGISAGDLYPDVNSAQFLLYSRSPGWTAAQVQATLTASPDLAVLHTGTNTFEDNLSDLRPRNHLCLGAGLNKLPVAFTFDTTQIPDGFHELTLVGYEGTSVRTQSRVSRTVQVRNTSLSATLAPQIVGTNVALGTPLSMSVVVNTKAIVKIELFTTGGSIGVRSNAQSAVFTVATDLLGPGQHPFYALVTDASGNLFRTQTIAIRIIPPFQVTISNQPLALSWNAVPGLTYEVLSSMSLSGPFLQVGTVIASGATAQWALPALTDKQAFFRIQLAP